MPLLDGVRIRQLRHAAGLSTRALARNLATSPTTVAHIEDETNHGELSLRFTTDLARLLGVAPAELFRRQANEVPEPASDDRTVEAALLIASAATSDSALATALGWDLVRVRDALRLLSVRLHHTGVRLHDHGWQRHALRPATEHLSEAQQHALHRIGPLQRGLTAETASMLHQVAEGAITEASRRTASVSQQIALQSLIKQGLIIADADGRCRLAETALLGLYPDKSG